MMINYLHLDKERGEDKIVTKDAQIAFLIF